MRPVSAVRDPVTLTRRYIFMDMTSRSILVGTHMVLHSRLPLIPIGDDALATADKRAQIWLFPGEAGAIRCDVMCDVNLM